MRGDAAVEAPTALTESFLVVGPIGPDRELIKLWWVVFLVDEDEC